MISLPVREIDDEGGTIKILSSRTRLAVPQGSLVVAEQFSASIRNLAILLLLSRSSDPALTAALMVTFTSTQMVASLGFATVGEPAMLAPKRWIAGAGFGRVKKGGLAFAGISFAATCVVGLLMRLDPLVAGAMAILAGVMAWADTERVLHFLLGRSLVPLARNCLILIIGFSMAILNVPTDYAVALLGMTWLAACVISRCPQPTASNECVGNRWSGKRPAATGIIDVGVSYLVIQGTLLVTIALFGPSMAGPLRLAQSLLGPVQMMASGLRNAVTMRDSFQVSWTSRRLIWFISPICASFMVVLAFAFPRKVAEWLMGPQWIDILHILPALAVQVSIVSIGAIGAARLRLMGYYAYVSALRIGSGALSLAGFWSLARFWDGLDPGVVLLGLSVGPTVAAPFWIWAMRGKCSRRD